VFPRFWTRGLEGDRETILRAAAVLWAQAGEVDTAKPVALLTEALARTDSEPLRTNLRLALAGAAALRRDSKTLHALTSQLAASHPLSETAFRLHTGGLMRDLRWEECREFATSRLERLPDDPSAIRVLTEVAVAKGDLSEADRLGRLLISKGKAEPNDWNNLAWWALYRPPITEQALKDAQQAVSLLANRDSASLHTLASLYAEAGKTTEARDVLWQALEAGGRDQPDAEDWFVLGRMAEHFDAPESAAAAYRKVEKPKEEHMLAQSTYVLAQRRLEALAKSR
jgi:tetratricopeptide (TPR) repeat protein